MSAAIHGQVRTTRASWPPILHFLIAKPQAFAASESQARVLARNIEKNSEHHVNALQKRATFGGFDAAQLWRAIAHPQQPLGLSQR